MPSPPEASATARAFCYRCHKARSTCVCATIPLVDNRTAVLVIQHPAEQFHPIGSVRFARLGLTNCEVAVAAKSTTGSLSAAHSLPPGAALLYPGQGARALEDLPPEARPQSLVVLEGTWTTVRALLAGDPRLRALPRVSIAPAVEGRYRIRREPRAECASTLEALVEALRIVEPERDAHWNALIEAFDRMIDRQIEIVATRGRPRPRRVSKRPQFRAVPVALGPEGGPMVVAHVESTQINRFGQSGTRRRRQVVSVHAARIVDGVVVSNFTRVVAIAGAPPSAVQLGFLDLTAAAAAAGCSDEELRAGWNAFAGPRDRVCAWNQLTLDLLPPSIGSGARYVLKGIYADFRQRRAGALESACQGEALCLDRVSSAPRGKARLNAAVAMYTWLTGQVPHRRAGKVIGLDGGCSA